MLDMNEAGNLGIFQHQCCSERDLGAADATSSLFLDAWNGWCCLNTNEAISGDSVWTHWELSTGGCGRARIYFKVDSPCSRNSEHLGHLYHFSCTSETGQSLSASNCASSCIRALLPLFTQHNPISPLLDSSQMQSVL